MTPLLWILLLFLLLIAALVCCYWWISRIANPYLYDSIEALPIRKTALLLGTAKYTTGGQLNQFFANRIAQAIRVCKNSKAENILISGADKVPKTPDEVDIMYDSLLQTGILPGAILMDHQGTRTWYSVLCCKIKYKVTDPIIISQRFHNQRAVFIALKLGMHPVGINAENVFGPIGTKMILRESLARVKCLVDCYLLKPQIKG